MSSLLQRTASALANTGPVTLNYDYERIPAADRDAVRSAALEIKPRLKRAAEDIFAVGEQLNAIKDRLPHGQWLPWIETEFEMAERTARNFMAVADRFEGKSAIIADLPPTALYLLAAPSTPDAVVEEVIERKQAGQKVGVAEVKRAVQAAKPNQADQEVQALTWLRNYTDDKGRTWQNLEDNQVFHANSPCYQAFTKAHPEIDHPAQRKYLLQKALDRLRKQHAATPVEVRPLNQAEAEAVIARWLERHYLNVSDGRKLELVLGCNVHTFGGVIAGGRSLEPGTLQAAKMAIADQLQKRIDAAKLPAPASPTPAKAGRSADPAIGVGAAADMIRSIIASGDPHPEIIAQRDREWTAAIEVEYGRRPMVQVVYQALVNVVRERAATPAVVEPSQTADDRPQGETADSPDRPQRRRNVREAVQDALLAINSVKADASALGIGSLDTAIVILQNIFDQVRD